MDTAKEAGRDLKHNAKEAKYEAEKKADVGGDKVE